MFTCIFFRIQFSLIYPRHLLYGWGKVDTPVVDPRALSYSPLNRLERVCLSLHSVDLDVRFYRSIPHPPCGATYGSHIRIISFFPGGDWLVSIDSKMVWRRLVCPLRARVVLVHIGRHKAEHYFLIPSWLTVSKEWVRSMKVHVEDHFMFSMFLLNLPGCYNFIVTCIIFTQMSSHIMPVGVEQAVAPEYLSHALYIQGCATLGTSFPA